MIQAANSWALWVPELGISPGAPNVGNPFPYHFHTIPSSYGSSVGWEVHIQLGVMNGLGWLRRIPYTTAGCAKWLTFHPIQWQGGGTFTCGPCRDEWHGFLQIWRERNNQDGWLYTVRHLVVFGCVRDSTARRYRDDVIGHDKDSEKLTNKYFLECHNPLWRWVCVWSLWTTCSVGPEPIVI